MNTNCFIEPWNKFYSYKSHRAYWNDFIIKEIKNNNLIVLEDVYFELERIDDNLLKWFKEEKINKKLTRTDEDLTRRVSQLLEKYPKLINSQTGRSVADPFLIEYAKREDITLITLEEKSGKIDKPKIPDICEKEDVKCIDLYKYIDESNVSFVLE